MIGTMTLTGGLLAAGYATYKRSTNRTSTETADGKSWRERLNNWFTNHSKSADESKAEANGILLKMTDSSRDAGALFGLRTSSLSLGLATTGLLFAPPLVYASIPTLLFMGYAPAQEAYEALRGEGRFTPALAETAVLAIFLAGGYLWIGSLGFSAYYLGRVLLDMRRAESTSILPSPGPFPETAHLHTDDGFVDVSVVSLQSGDRIGLESGELSPVHGLIIDGSAWLKAANLSPHAGELLKGPGDRICPLDVVVVGHISVQVQNA